MRLHFKLFYKLWQSVPDMNTQLICRRLCWFFFSFSFIFLTNTVVVKSLGNIFASCVYIFLNIYTRSEDLFNQGFDVMLWPLVYWSLNFGSSSLGGCCYSHTVTRCHNISVCQCCFSCKLEAEKVLHCKLKPKPEFDFKMGRNFITILIRFIAFPWLLSDVWFSACSP